MAYPANDRGSYAKQLRRLQELRQAESSGPLVDLLSSMMAPSAIETCADEQKPPAGAGDEDAEALAELKQQGLAAEQAGEVLAQIKQAHAVEDCDAESGEEPDIEESLLESVRRWVHGRGNLQVVDAKEALSDFNLKVRFQGHERTTPPEHLAALLEVLSEDDSRLPDAATWKQPMIVAQRVQGSVNKWASMLHWLYSRCDAPIGAELIVSAVARGAAGAQEVFTVGFLMALREELDITDEDLLTGCRAASQGKAMQAFIDFLAKADDSESDGG